MLDSPSFTRGLYLNNHSLSQHMRNESGCKGLTGHLGLSSFLCPSPMVTSSTWTHITTVDVAEMSSHHNWRWLDEKAGGQIPSLT